MKANLLYKFDDVPTALNPWLVPDNYKFVSENYLPTHDIKPCYNNLDDALTDAVSGDTIILYSGTYSGNFTLGAGITLVCDNNTYLEPMSLTTPILTMVDTAKVYGLLTIVGDSLTSGYDIAMSEGCVLEAKDLGSDIYIGGGDGTISVTGISGHKAYIKATEHLGIIDISGAVGDVYIESTRLASIDYTNTTTGAKGHVKTDLLIKFCKVNSGTLSIKFDQAASTSGNILQALGGKLIASCRIADYSYGSNTSTGQGYPVMVQGGIMILHDSQIKNGGGGVCWVGGSPGYSKLILIATVLEAGSAGGGTDPAIFALPGTNVIYSGNTSANSSLAGGGAEAVTTNRIIDSAVVIG